MSSQVKNGKALEYAFLYSLYQKLSKHQEVKLVITPSVETAAECFNSSSAQDKQEMLKAADTGNEILLQLEPRLHVGSPPLRLTLQSDRQGTQGDVRDLIAIRGAEGWEVGVSCKNNHDALKHSRLANTINFGKVWLGFPCTKDYFDEIRPIFNEMEELKNRGAKWSQIAEKEERYYMPVLRAFMKELQRLYERHGEEVPKRLLAYLLGRQDFYKAIVRRRDRITEIQGFNHHGTLNQPAGNRKPQLRMPKIKLPTQIYDINFKPDSKNKIEIVCNEGWAVSGRIHNASSKVEKSLKFDFRLVGLPQSVYHNVQSWR